MVFDLEDAVAAAKEGYPRILALVEDTLEVYVEGGLVSVFFLRKDLLVFFLGVFFKEKMT